MLSAAALPRLVYLTLLFFPRLWFVAGVLSLSPRRCPLSAGPGSPEVFPGFFLHFLKLEVPFQPDPRRATTLRMVPLPDSAFCNCLDSAVFLLPFQFGFFPFLVDDPQPRNPFPGFFAFLHSPRIGVLRMSLFPEIISWPAMLTDEKSRSCLFQRNLPLLPVFLIPSSLAIPLVSHLAFSGPDFP